MGKKNKGSIQQEEQSPPQDQGQSMEFEVVPDQPESPEDDAWFTSTGKGQSAVEHVPVTRSQAKKEKASEVIVEGDITHETDRKSKKQAKKEKLAEETKKAEEEAAKKAKEEAKTSSKKKKGESKVAPAKAEPTKVETKKREPEVKKQNVVETKKRDEAPKKAKVKTPVVSEDESPAPKRTRKHDSSPSPSPDSIFKGGKKKGARYEKESKSRKEKSEADISSNGTVHWLQKNWKTALITALILGLFIWIKIKEDTFNRMNMNTTEQAQNDLYELLGVTQSASLEDIKKGYKTRAGQLHPDKNPGCTDCQEKFNEVTKAYETLTNAESRKFYDATNGIVNPLKSMTHQLTSRNYQRLVEDSNDIWIIMVYLDTDETSSQFMNFWDEIAKEYPFIQFGRINFASQPRLVSQLPFRVEEIPFVLSVLPDGTSEYFEFDAYSDASHKLRKFVRESIEKTYKESSVEQIKSDLQSSTYSDKPHIVHITRNAVPISYSYLSYKFQDKAEYHVSKTGDHRRIYNVMDQQYIDYIVRLPSNLTVNDEKIVSFKFGSESKTAKESEHMAIFPFVKFLNIPELKRSSFNEYCTDYTTSEDTESIKPSVCIVALKGSDDKSFGDFMQLFKEEQQTLLPKFYKQTSEKNSDIFDAIKSMQFAYIDVKANKKFSKFVNDAVEIKNPRAFVFVSALNKIKFYNSVDDLGDDLDDIEKGNYASFSYVTELTKTEEPFASLLVPERASILKILIRSILNWFTSIMMLTTAGIAIFSLNRFSQMKYHIAALIIVGTFAAVGLFEGVMHSNKLGLL